MLYVFLVDTGKMVAFDMNLALESVSRLKEEIYNKCGIEKEKQVLLVSGGESLNPMARVCNYSAAGTDTNPIFLFDTRIIENDVPPSPSVAAKSVDDGEHSIEALMNMPPTFVTIVSRSQSAEQYHEKGKEELRACEQIVHDQHLQQQGWAAVVANLDDITCAFKKRAELIQLSFQAYMEKKSREAPLLENFDQDLETLKKIPVLKSLRCRTKEDSTSEESKPLSLLEWINSTDNQRSLESVAEQCVKGLEQFDEKFHTSLMMETAMALSQENNSNMKEVKGLEERLYGLDQLMSEAKRRVQEQAELAQAFLQNQTRAGNLADDSILPDLCTNQRKPLLIMAKNHHHLKDIRSRCIKAKEELAVNLHMRLRWVMYVERQMGDVDGKLVIYHENLKRLRRHLDVVHQIHLAPSVYCLSVAEVFRRKSFSKQYLKWCRELSQQASVAYEKEVSARNEYIFKVGNHFLQSLFPGLDSVPGEFALRPPEEFDAELPNISSSDVQLLRNLLPEAANILDTSFAQKSPFLAINNELPTMRDVFVSAIESTHSASMAICNAQDAPTLESPVDDKDPESEPDTEEFEKVDQCPGLTDVVLTADSGKDDVTAANEKVIYLQEAISKIREKHAIMIDEFRLNLNDTKMYFNNCKDDITDMTTTLTFEVTQKINSAFNANQSGLVKLKRDYFEKVQNELSSKLENALSSGWDLVNQRCDQIISYLESRIKDCVLLIGKLEKKFADRTTSLRRLTLEHELEMVNLREDHKIDCAAFDDRIKELVEELTDKAKEMNKIREEVKSESEAKWQLEKQDIVAKFEAEFALREQNMLRTKLEEIELKHENELTKIREEADSNLAQKTAFLQSQFNEELALQKNDIMKDKELAIEQVKEAMYKSYQAEMATLKVKAMSMDRSPSDGSLERIEHPESTETIYLEQQLNQLRGDMQDKDAQILDMRKLYEIQIQELQEKFEKSQEVPIRMADNSAVTEQQVILNEAVNRLSSDKDETIRDLQAQVAQLKQELQHGNRTLLSPTIEFHSGPLGESVFVSSNIEPSTSVEDQMSRSVPIQMEASALIVPGATNVEKLSFLTCSVGDLVLLTYDLKHEHYMVFTVGPSLYFLNSDCWDDLGLGKDSGETRKSWVIGYVTEKEYCQARKEQNRFRVAIGTRFYRIRVKPWTSDSSKRVGTMHMSSHSGISSKKANMNQPFLQIGFNSLSFAAETLENRLKGCSIS